MDQNCYLKIMTFHCVNENCENCEFVLHEYEQVTKTKYEYRCVGKWKRSSHMLANSEGS